MVGQNSCLLHIHANNSNSDLFPFFYTDILYLVTIFHARQFLTFVIIFLYISYSLLCATIDKKEGEEEGIEGGQCKKVTKERLMEYNSNKREQAIMAIIQMRREVALFRRKEESPEKRFSMPGKSEGQSKDNL